MAHPVHRPVVLALVVSSAVCFANDTLTSIAVMDFGGQNVSATDASVMADRFRYELGLTGRFSVMEREEMTVILKEQAFQQSGCVDQKCAVEAGQLIAVKKIVTGTVARVGGIYTVNIRLIDVATGRIDVNASEDCDCPIEKVLTATLRHAASRLAGVETRETAGGVAIKRGDASLFIKTDPPEASVYLNGTLMDGRTPLTLENLTAGRYTVMVKKAELVAKKEVDLVGNQVVRTSLTLAKQQTILKIMSNPSEAEVYVNKRPGTGVKPDQITPAIFEKLTGEKVEVTLFKVGYRDTTLVCPLLANEINAVSVPLSEADVELIKKQKRLVTGRRHRSAGIYLSLASLALLAAGGGTYYWAQRDYDEALDAKRFLEQSSIKSGAEYDRRKKINQDKSASGDLKTNIGYGLLGGGGAGLAAGLVLYF